LFVTVDSRHDLALLRGDGAHDAVKTLSLEATWSPFGRGWVADARHVADVVAYCESRHELCVVSNRKPPEKAAAS
jgi:hypothetical protein